ncbi:hypothetical protein TcWFU_000994 [Taenia crassiceps]|uniref:Uncharacterized protein n=1 Tax=Taenia crassiceps TaxID=6207 RepID=A0ABR4Q6X5_9CEST
MLFNSLLTSYNRTEESSCEKDGINYSWAEFKRFGSTERCINVMEEILYLHRTILAKWQRHHQRNTLFLESQVNHCSQTHATCPPLPNAHLLSSTTHTKSHRLLPHCLLPSAASAPSAQGSIANAVTSHCKCSFLHQTCHQSLTFTASSSSTSSSSSSSSSTTSLSQTAPLLESPLHKTMSRSPPHSNSPSILHSPFSLPPSPSPFHLPPSTFPFTHPLLRPLTLSLAPPLATPSPRPRLHPSI